MQNLKLEELFKKMSVKQSQMEELSLRGMSNTRDSRAEGRRRSPYEERSMERKEDDVSSRAAVPNLNTTKTIKTTMIDLREQSHQHHVKESPERSKKEGVRKPSSYQPTQAHKNMHQTPKDKTSFITINSSGSSLKPDKKDSKPTAVADKNKTRNLLPNNSLTNSSHSTIVSKAQQEKIDYDMEMKSFENLIDNLKLIYVENLKGQPLNYSQDE